MDTLFKYIPFLGWLLLTILSSHRETKGFITGTFIVIGFFIIATHDIQLGDNGMLFEIHPKKFIPCEDYWDTYHYDALCP